MKLRAPQIMSAMLAGFLAALTSIAQQNDATPWSEAGLWPESPRAAAFRQATSPVPALSTGAATFDLPLYTLKVADFRLPLSLVYHSNGIPVDAEWQPVGYGWTLQPALRVTRQIYGRPDEMFAFAGDFSALQCDYNLQFRAVTPHINETDGNVNDDDRYDPAHDLFSIHLPGRTLTAIYDGDTLIAPGCREYKIDIDTILTYIRVTDPLGRVYNFDTPGQCHSSPQNRAEWLLTSIRLPQGDVVNFEWQPSSRQQQRFFSPITVELENNFLYPPERVTIPVLDALPMFAETETFNTRELSRIIFDRGRGAIDFAYGTYGQATDMLRMMTVSYDGNNVRTVTFDHGNAGLDGRLLTGVTLPGEGKYTFTYDPVRFDHPDGRDLWGYYNGKANSMRLTPKLHINMPGLYGPSIFDLDGADRRDDYSAITANLLRRVDYPTGGSCTWHYEPHRFAPVRPDSAGIAIFGDSVFASGGGVRVSKTVLRTSDTSGDSIVRTYIYGHNGNGLGICAAAPFPSTFAILQKTIIGGWNADRLPIRGRGRVMLINRRSNYRTGRFNTPDVWYDEVAQLHSTGKAVHRFSEVLPAENPRFDTYKREPHPGRISRAFAEPISQTSVDYYEQRAPGAFSLVQTDSIIFHTFQMPSEYWANLSHIRNYIQTQNALEAPDFGDNGFCFTDEAPVPDVLMGLPVPARLEAPPDVYASDNYFIDGNYVLPVKTVTLRHTPTGAMRLQEEFDYLPGTSLVRSATRTDAAGRSCTTQTVYAAADTSALRRGIPKGALLSRTVICDGAVTGHENEITVDDSGHAVVTAITRRMGRERWRPAQYEYDCHGRLVKLTSADSVITTWNWDAAGRNPMTQTIAGNLTARAQWLPLTGIAALTTPSSRRTDYTYDDEGRLANVSRRACILKSFEYHTALSSADINTVRENTHTGINTFHSTVTRYDGLGRPMAVFVSTPEGWDTKLTDYDAMGRPYRDWSDFPVRSTTASTTELQEAAQAYYNDNAPFAETLYEPSPRNVVIGNRRQSQEARNQGRKVTIRTLANTSTGKYSCQRYKLGNDGVIIDGRWPAGTLQITETTDENGIVTRRWTDLLKSQTVRTDCGDDAVHYVYDDYGQLRYGMPPGLTDGQPADPTEMGALGWAYTYDARGNCTSVKSPGAEPHQMRYDPAGRLVAERDGHLATDTWMLHAYDAAGRHVLKVRSDLSDLELDDWCSVVRTASLSDLPDEYDRGGYTVHPQPLAWPGNAVWARYFDDYAFIGLRGLGDEFRFQEPVLAGGLHVVQASARGLLTGIWTGRGHEVYYYDDDERVVQSYADGYKKGRTITTYNYDGTVASQHKQYPQTLLPAYDRMCTYDRCGRLTRAEMHLGPFISGPNRLPATSGMTMGTTTTLTYTYDNAGRLAGIGYGTQGARTQFVYDCHGWPVQQTTTDASGRTFTLNFEYRWNGTPSSRASTDLGRYNYAYDDRGRLTEAAYTAVEGSTADFSTAYDYDARGNLLELTRRGIVDYDPADSTMTAYGLLDHAWYTLRGNRTVAVNCSTQGLAFCGLRGLAQTGEWELEHNGAGDVDTDPARGLLRMRWGDDGNPRTAEIDGGHKHTFIYDGLGNLMGIDYEVSISPVVAGQLPGCTRRIGARRYTADGHVLRAGTTNTSPDTLLMLHFDGGYFDSSGNAHYYVTDEQGSNIAELDADGRLISRTGYYPYGEPWSLPSDAVPGTHYLHCGKEYLTDDGLTEYRYGARRHVASRCQFASPDPLGAKTPWLSPYAFCAANPVGRTDSSGLLVYFDDWFLQGVLDGLSPAEAQSISVDKNGLLNTGILLDCESNSKAIQALKLLASSQTIYECKGVTELNVKDKYIEFADEPENGIVGVVQMPNIGTSDIIAISPDDNVHVYTSKHARPSKRATNVAHELYGHAYFYERMRQGEDLLPLHDGDGLYEPSYDERGELNKTIYWIPKNLQLESQIKMVEESAGQRYLDKHP